MKKSKILPVAPDEANDNETVAVNTNEVEQSNSTPDPIDRLELVRTLPEVEWAEESKQAQGGIEHFKDVDGRTMNVVVHGGELKKQMNVSEC